jgi:hypothetical protein
LELVHSKLAFYGIGSSFSMPYSVDGEFGATSKVDGKCGRLADFQFLCWARVRDAALH